MDASSSKTNVNEMCMGRPSDETLEREDDDRNIKHMVVPSDFENLEGKSDPSFHTLEDWLQHEAERFRPIHITLSESSAALTVRADVPGVKEEDLRIKVEPDRVMITRKPAIAKRYWTGFSVSCPDETSRVFELPSPVTVNKVRIAVKDGVLELDLAKASAGAAPERTEGGESCAN
jgi:HSP20 family protein